MDESIEARPWYREPWPWIIMAGPALAVIAGIATAIIAFSGADALVADDYYKRGLGINRELKRSVTAATHAMHADLEYDVAGRRIRVALYRADAGRDGEIVLYLAHPTRAADDRRVTLARGADGQYHGAVALPETGRWHLVLETAEWRVEGDWTDPAQPVALRPAS